MEQHERHSPATASVRMPPDRRPEPERNELVAPAAPAVRMPSPGWPGTERLRDGERLDQPAAVRMPASSGSFGSRGTDRDSAGGKLDRQPLGGVSPAAALDRERVPERHHRDREPADGSSGAVRSRVSRTTSPGGEGRWGPPSTKKIGRGSGL